VRLSSAFSIVALFAACAPSEPQPTDGDRVPEQVISGASLLAEFSTDGSDLVSPPMIAPDQATVVGLMLEANGSVAVEARGIDDDGRRGHWHKSEETWREGDLAVARIELGMTAVAVELKIARTEAEKIRVLTWSAIVPQPLQPSPKNGYATSRSGLSAALSAAGVKSRADWGARATQCSTLDTTKTKMAVHHTVSPPTSNGDFEARLRQTQAYHMDTRGWCDVGYHFFVTIDGTSWEAREARFLGAHVSDNNSNNVGVVFVGCFTPGDTTCETAGYGPTTPPEVMIQEGGRLLGLLADEYGITVDSQRVLGHRDHPGAQTGCPGDALYARLADLRSIANGSGPGPVEGSARGVIWDLSRSAGPADPGNLRVESARVTCSNGESTSVRAGDAFWSFNLDPGRYTFTAEAPGYATATRELEITGGGESWGSIGLLPSGMMAMTVPVEVLVYDAAVGQSAPLAEVQVSLRGGAAVTTNAAGLATFTATAGPATISAAKTGFVTASRAITIGGSSTRVELALAPIPAPIEGDAGVMPMPDPEEGGDEVPMPPVEEESGCGCRDLPSGTHPSSLWALALALVLLRKKR
jgi:hypothetical protein